MADFEGMVEEYMAGLESIMQFEPVNTIPGVNRSTWNFLFQKELKRSDVGPTRRFVIPKRDAEMYLPPLTNKRGLFMLMHDMDIERIWTFRYRSWNNSNSPMFILEKTGDFVLEHGLRAGDFIMIYKDNERGIYGIQARKVVSLEASRRNEEVRSINNHSTPVIWDKIDAYFPFESGSISNLRGEVVPNNQNFGQPLSF